MNRHGQRFVELRDFISHANSLNVRLLRNDELEFYEKHCLLLPAVVFRHPSAHLIAVTQNLYGWPVENPEDREPPDALRRLEQPRADGLHPFEAEREQNPLLETLDCTTFKPWDADDKVVLTDPDGHTVQERTVERYYSPWQVHGVKFLRQRRYYYVHSQFLQLIEPSHDLWKWHRIPENTEQIRSLRGMADGFEALERFLFADQVALHEAFEDVDGVTLSESAQERLHITLTTWARRSLEISDLDEPAFFQFLFELTHLIDGYRRNERIALAEDADEYLRDAQTLARYAFEYDWDGFLEAAEEHVGPGLSTQLRRLDPIEAAVRDAKENLRAILGQNPVSAIADGCGDTGTMPDDIVRFCLDHDLLEVLYGIQRFTYTNADLRRDRFPGFFHRGLRLVALSGEQLARGILDAPTERGHDESMNHHGSGYRGLVKILGKDSSWLAQFMDLRTWDGAQGDLEQHAVRLAEAAYADGAERDDVIANTFAAAVATRNLVSHRHRLLSSRDARTLANPCADAVVLIWLTARERGLV